MRLVILTSLITLFFCVCQPRQNTDAFAQTPSGMHKVLVKEVLQTSNYTYLLVDDQRIENWLALPKMQASVGDTYYYKNGFKMTDFESQELKRKFETIYFLQSISSTPDLIPPDPAMNPHTGMHQIFDSASVEQYSAKVVVEKEDVNLKPDDQGVTIAQLLENPLEYDGKVVRVKGQVTKFNASIMKRNWIHIQDGTEYSGKFDLTVTTDIEVAVGETVTLEGVITLNKDFGYGYSYEILLEDARLMNK